MAIDPRIPLMGVTPEPIDPFKSAGKVLAIRELQARDAQQQRELQRQQQLEALAQQYGDDPEEFVRQVTRVDPETGFKIGKFYQDQKASKLTAYGKQLENETAGFELATRELQAVPEGDVPTAAAWRSRWVSRDPQLDKMLPPPEQLATAEVRTRVLNLGLSTVEFNKAKAEGVKAFLTGDYQKGLGNTLAAAPSFEVAEATLKEAEASGVMPRAVVASFRTMLENADGDLAAFQAAAGNAALTEDQRLRALNSSEKPAGSDYAQFLTTYAQERGKRPDQLTVAENLAARKAFGQADDKPTAAGEGTGPKPGDAALVDAIIANPGLYAGITPTTKERLIGPLMARGFKGFAGGAAGKPSTGLQKKALGYFNRAKQAADELLQITESGMGLGAQTYAEYAPNFMQTQQGQAYLAAQRAFTEARLRKDSGAAIPENEFKSDRDTYFRKPGDTDATLAQKRRGRAAMLASLAFEAGPALAEYYGEEADEMLAKYKADTQIGGAGGGGAAPANVQAALSGKGPGRYTLSDGSVWQKSPDGTLAKAK